ncbi:hypothetical protein NIES4073_13170 [Kalymmatonema gypsitolerans NIES-4073]|nr:hypothetical protein NIES4073_13170 [Scytonema sp. NIES-4073]
MVGYLRSCTQQEPEALISRYQVEPGNEGLEPLTTHCCNSCKISVTAHFSDHVKPQLSCV